MKKFTNLATLLFFIFLLFALPNMVYATHDGFCHDAPIGGNYSVSANAQFSGTVNGVDSGSGTTNTASMTIPSGVAFTVAAGQTIVFGRDASNVGISLNGTMNIVNTGQLRQGPLWMTDVDADTYPDTTTQIFQLTQPTNTNRRNLMNGIGGTHIEHLSSDCSTTSSNVFQNIAGLGSDNDQDAYTDTAAATQCVGTSTTVATRTYYRDSAAAFSWLVDTQKLGTSDCNDASATVWQNLTCYADSDADTVAVSTASTLCSGSSCPAGYLGTAGSDCLDTDATRWVNKYTDSDGDGYCAGDTLTCVGTHTGFRTPPCNGYGDSGTCDTNTCVDTLTTGPGWSQDSDNDGYCGSCDVVAACLGGSSTSTINGRTYYRNTGCGWTWIGTIGGGMLGTGDCCDSDANAKPGQTAYFTTARTTCGGFDYNCDSGVETKDPALDCQAVGNWASNPCPATNPHSGYVTSVAVPACGASGTWVRVYTTTGTCGGGGTGSPLGTLSASCSDILPAGNTTSASANNITQTIGCR